MVDLDRSQRSADRMIKRWGFGSTAQLVRAGVARPCFAARLEYSPRERGLFLDGSERFYISAYNLAVPPSHELDVLQWKPKGATAFTEYKIMQPPTGPRPNGLVIYFDCNCMRVRTV